MADRNRSVSTPHRYSLVAAASVIASKSVRNKVDTENQLAWQEEAWRYFDSVGEFRFGVSWLANGLSRVNLVGARQPEQVGDEPVAIDLTDETAELTAVERRAAELVQQIAGGASGQGQLLGEFGEHLSVAGLGWLVAEPDLGDEQSDLYETWGVYSQDSLKFEERGDEQIISIRTGGSGADGWRTLHPNALIVKCWRKHPRRWWEPDAPVRAVLSVLAQIDLLTAHIVASGRSRLAGAGLLVIPAEAEFPDPPAIDSDEDTTEQQDGFDYFVEQMTEAMAEAIKDRDSAAGVVPLAIAVPGEYIDKLQHLTFSTPFDEKVDQLLAEAIKRLALGMDMPPEILTGMDGVNHWTAWQVEETAITLHIEPNAEIVCHALTEGFLYPALAAENFTRDEIATVMTWYDARDLVVPPDKSGNALNVFDRKGIGFETLRRETGFGEEDRPSDADLQKMILLDMLQLPGAPEALSKVLGIDLPAPPPAPSETTPGLPAPANETPTQGTPPIEDRPQNQDAALLAACDGIAYRAMERAGAKLRPQIGRQLEGGAAAVTCTDVTTLHMTYDPTVYADLDMLLDGAFARVPDIAPRYGIDPDQLTESLRAYTRGLLASQQAHTVDRLASFLGV